MNRDQAVRLQKRALHDWVGAMGGSSPGAHVFERDGVRAAVVPACPLRSVPNSVAYETASALAAAQGDLDAVYADAGVVARTVWVPDFDAETIAVLEGAGHVLDGTPAAMSLELDGFEALDPGDLEWSAEAAPADHGRLNDLAYDLGRAEGMATALIEKHPDMTLYDARANGDVVCVLGTMEHDSDLGFYFVATHPEHQGKGIASRLMSVVLANARKRGLETSTLQSSAKGQPVYERLGFVEHFRLNMYEKRTA